MNKNTRWILLMVVVIAVGFGLLQDSPILGGVQISLGLISILLHTRIRGWLLGGCIGAVVGMFIFTFCIIKPEPYEIRRAKAEKYIRSGLQIRTNGKQFVLYMRGVRSGMIIGPISEAVESRKYLEDLVELMVQNDLKQWEAEQSKWEPVK